MMRRRFPIVFLLLAVGLLFGLLLVDPAASRGSGSSGGGGSPGGGGSSGGGSPGNGASGGGQNSGPSGNGGMNGMGSMGSGRSDNAGELGGDAPSHRAGDKGQDAGRDHDLAREAVLRGNALPFAAVMPTVQAAVQGDMLDVKLRRLGSGLLVYDVKIVSPNGTFRSILVDAKRNRIVSGGRL